MPSCSVHLARLGSLHAHQKSRAPDLHTNDPITCEIHRPSPEAGEGPWETAIVPLFGLLLSPMIAAAAMSFSSVSVIGNALRLRRERLKGKAP